MKAIFLDVDGVLNDENFIISCVNLLGKIGFHKLRNGYQETPLNPKSCERIRKLALRTGAAIILSSTWRLKPQSINTVEECLCYNIYDITIPQITGQKRGKEIKTYLEKHPEITQYVIIDDDIDMLPSQKSNFCHVNRKIGFSEVDYKFCVEVLNDK